MGWKHNRVKPVIGLAGGIGSGKSSVARMFLEEGCGVINSDVDAHEVLQSEEVRGEIRSWMEEVGEAGRGVFLGDGSVSRKGLGAFVFSDGRRVERLNGIIHPRVAERREGWMRIYMGDGKVKAVVWDTPLLFEAGLEKECDVIVFVDVAREVRVERVRKERGWGVGAGLGGEGELEKREKLQIPLDKKAKVADYCVDNSGDEASSLRQVQRILSQILASVDE